MTYQVCAYQRANVRPGPSTEEDPVSFVVADECYPANCWTRGETISDNGVTNDVWVQLALNAGGVGYVSAVYLKGDDFGDLPPDAWCGLPV